MFTGIVETTGRIQSITRKKGSTTLLISAPRGWKLKLGQSIAVQGICSTVCFARTERFEVEYMPETLSKTTVSSWKLGDEVNLERSLLYGEPVDGHIVQGHIDARGHVVALRSRGNSREITIRIPGTIAPYVAAKGSIAVDGVSLTVARRRANTFTVALVSYTLTHTTLLSLKIGDEVHIETDLIARYLARLLKK